MSMSNVDCCRSEGLLYWVKIVKYKKLFKIKVATIKMLHVCNTLKMIFLKLSKIRIPCKFPVFTAFEKKMV